MTWTSWGSRGAPEVPALSDHRRIGLVLRQHHPDRAAGSTARQERRAADRIQQIRVAPWSEAEPSGRRDEQGTGRGQTEAFDRPRETLALAETKVTAPPPAISNPTPVRPQEAEPATETATPELPLLSPPEPAEHPDATPAKEPATPPAEVAPSDPNDIAAAVAKRAEAGPEARLLPESNDRLRTDPGSADPPAPGTTDSAGLPKLTAPAFTEPLEDRPDNAHALPAETGPMGLAGSDGQEVAAPRLSEANRPVGAFPCRMPTSASAAGGVVAGLGAGFETPPRTLAPRPMLSAGADPFGIGSARLSEPPRPLSRRRPKHPPPSPRRTRPRRASRLES